MNARVVIAAAEGIVTETDRTLLFKKGGYIKLSLDWAYPLLKKMGYVKRKAAQTRTAFTQEEFAAVKNNIFGRSRKQSRMAKSTRACDKLGPDGSECCAIFPVDSSRARKYKC